MKQNVTIYLLYFVLFITSDLIYLSSSEPLSSEMLNSREGDRLAVATSNSIIVIRLLKDSLITSKDLQMATVIQANDYNAEIFSISYKDNLILYGKDSILAKPIESGDNFINANGVTSLGIEFDGHFTVDWVDYNVYVFKKRSLTVHSLLVPQYSTVVYNGSMKVRNIAVENDRHFLAWISNDNNIMRSGKDGSFPLNLWTEKTGTIHCMTLSPINDRIYYATLSRALKNVQVEVHKEDHVEKVIKSFDAYFVFIYSIDYDGKFEPVKEVTFEVNSSWTKVISMTRYHKELFFITLDFEQSENGVPAPKKTVEEMKKDPDQPGPFKVYRLWHYERGPIMLKEERHLPMTSVMVAWYNPGNTSLCKQKNCPQICMSINSNTAKCYCKNNAETCQGIYTPPKKITQNTSSPNLSAVALATEGNGIVAAIDINNPPRSVTEKQPSNLNQNLGKPFSRNIWIIIIVVVFIFAAALLYTGYRCYYTSPTDETSDLTLKSTLSLGKDTAKMFDISIPSTDRENAEDPSNSNTNNQNSFKWLIGKLLSLLSFGKTEKVDETEETNEIPEKSTPQNDTTMAVDNGVDNVIINDVLPVKKKKKKKKKKKNNVTETTDDTTDFDIMPVKKKKKKKKKKLNQETLSSDSKQ